MGRPTRLDPEMGIHHVYTRGTKRWILFHDDVDRRRFLGALSRVCDRYGLKVIAFCLMDNHLHLVVQCPEQHLSDAMRDLKSSYARWFNDRHRSSGPIFEDRFGSKLVTSYRQLRILVRYVHRNPYSISDSIDLAGFPWASHGMYLGVVPSPVWLDTSLASALFTDYRTEVETPLLNDSVQNTGSPSEDVPDTSSLVMATDSLADIQVAVAHAANCQISEVHPQRRNGLIGVAVLIAHEVGFTTAEMTEPFGYRTIKAAQTALRRARIRLTSDHVMQETLVNARGRLTSLAA